MEAVFFRLVVEEELGSAIYMTQVLTIPQLSSEVALFRDYRGLAHEANHFELSFQVDTHTMSVSGCLWGLVALQVSSTLHILCKQRRDCF